MGKKRPAGEVLFAERKMLVPPLRFGLGINDAAFFE